MRRRPGFYIGGIGQGALQRLLIDAIEERLAAATITPCRTIQIGIEPDGSYWIEADGRSPSSALASGEDGLAQLADRFYDSKRGSFVVLGIMNALAERLTIEAFHPHHLRKTFRRGHPIGPVEACGPTAQTGMKIHFVPDRALLPELTLETPYPLLGNLRTIAALTPGLHVQLLDRRQNLNVAIQYQDGIRSYLCELDYDRDHGVTRPLFFAHATAQMRAEIALRWYATRPTTILSYVNRIPSWEHGSHVLGLRRGLAQGLDAYARASYLFGPEIPRLRARDIPQPLTAIVAVWLDTPSYANASKNRLHHPVAGRFVQEMVYKQLPGQLEPYHEDLERWAWLHCRRVARGE